MSIARTAIYVLSSVVVALTGLLVTILSNPKPVGLSIGTSLIAAGIASLAFVAMRFLDDRSDETGAAGTARSLQLIREQVAEQQQVVGDLRRITLTMSARTDIRAYGLYPGKDIDDHLSRTPAPRQIDSFGLSLGRLNRMHLDELAQVAGLTLRLLIQNPSHALFDEIVAQEQRDRGQCILDIVEVTRKALDLAASAESTVAIRWYDGYPTTTTLRIDNTILARVRLPKEPLQMDAFYERYTPEDARAFTLYANLFDSLWHESNVPSLERLSDAEKLLTR